MADNPETQAKSPENDSRIGLGWKYFLALWTMLIGPVMDNAPNPPRPAKNNTNNPALVKPKEKAPANQQIAPKAPGLQEQKLERSKDGHGFKR